MAASAGVSVTYAGGDRLTIRVRGHELRSDQPIEDGGEDTAATPTELFIASLAACVAFYAERFLRRNHLATAGLVVNCGYRWTESPHRVGWIDVAVEAPGVIPNKQEAFTRVMEHCAVHNTLEHPPAVRIHVVSSEAAAVNP
jgi:putative redox protein